MFTQGVTIMNNDSTTHLNRIQNSPEYKIFRNNINKLVRVCSFICFNYALFLCYSKPQSVILIQICVLVINICFNLLIRSYAKGKEWNKKTLTNNPILFKIESVIYSTLNILIKSTVYIFLSQIILFYFLELSIQYAIMVWYSFIIFMIVIYCSVIFINKNPKKNSKRPLDILYNSFGCIDRAIKKESELVAIDIFMKYYLRKKLISTKHHLNNR